MVIAQAIQEFSEDMPFGEVVITVCLDNKLYELKAIHRPAIRAGKIVEGKRWLEIKMENMG